ncbi:MAG: secondary thiamine-phosphate synthase enzyme YjbQ [Candidatus Acidiferrales bacterium]
MKIYGESFPLQASKQRETLNIHSRVKAAIEKCGFRQGVCVISSPDSDSAVVLMQDDAEVLQDVLQDLDRRFERIGSEPVSGIYSAESNSSARFQAMLLGQQVTIPFSEGRLEIGAGEAVFFLELNGVRPRRVVVKIFGE